MEFSYLATNLTWTDALTDESSSEFQLLAKSFCADINAILVKYPGIADFARGCKVISFQKDLKSIQWQLVYPGIKQSEFQVSINNAIFSDLSHVKSRSVEGVVIGGMLIHYKNIVTTSLSLELRILNLTWTEELTDIHSPVFHRISSSVSTDVDNMIKENSNDFPSYIESRITMFRNKPIRMVLELLFEGSLTGQDMADKFFSVVKTDKRMFRYRNFLGYMLGELLVFSENYTNLTIIPVTFSVLNMTWTDDLLNMSAADTQRYTQHITGDVDNLLSKSSSDLIHYETSRVTAFRNNPVRVSLEVQFDGIHDVTAYRHKVVDVIQRDSPKVFIQGNTANLVGDLLLYHGDFRPVKHNAWKSNITFFITEFMYYPQYQNHRSQLFLEFEEAFCDEISNYISKSDLASRYYRCLFEKIGDTPIHTLTFNLIFNGTENVSEHDVIDTITTHAIQFPGNLWYIADKLVYPGMFQNIAVNISDYNVSISAPTTAGPEGFTIINATFVTLNDTQIAGLKDPTSSAFRAMAEPFCNELNQIYKNVTITKKMYDSCEVKSFSIERKTQKITFVLKFKGQLESSIRNELFEILLEKAARTDVNGGITTIRIGTLLIYEESLNNYVTRRDVPSTTTAAPGICDGTKEYVADPANCRIFIFCAGQMSLQCPDEFSFSEEQNSCVPDSNCH